MDSNTPQDQMQNQDQPQTPPKQQVAERVRSAANVLVTVRTNPSVDELAATIGLTLMLNKLGKHATAVFSGDVPSTLEFLKPEETLETNTDSLRDFIVSLDKSKADKLRYKVEENVVKIFITPYRTSITQDDLEFTQGDFNVDVVLALGVTQREELDQAITSHGRILHDATVITVTAGQDYSELGQINWQEQGASSLSEMLVSISEALQGGLIDEQIATAFLTGIVSETERFSNPKTSPKVMTMAAQLMAAGANQQLIANELEKVVEVEVPNEDEPPQAEQPGDTIAIDESGTLSISHDDDPASPAEPESLPAPQPDESANELPEVQPEQSEKPARSDSEMLLKTPTEPLPAPSELELQKFLPPAPQPVIDSFEPGMTQPVPEPAADSNEPAQPEGTPPPEFLPPIASGEVDDNGNQIHIDVEGNMMRKAAAEPKHKVIQPLPSADEPEPPAAAEVLGGISSLDNQDQAADSAPVAVEPEAAEPPQGAASAFSTLPPPPEIDLTPSAPIQDATTLEQIEESVQSPHLSQAPPSPDSARDAVNAAFGQTPFDPSNNARADLGTLPLGGPPEQASYDSFRLPDAPAPVGTPATDVSGNLSGLDLAPGPQQPAPAFTLPGSEQPQAQGDGIAPPPVPPPMMPQ